MTKSLSKGFLGFIGAACGFFALSCWVIGAFIHYGCQRKRAIDSEWIAHLIQVHIGQTIKSLQNNMEILGREIIQDDPHNIEKIAQHLKLAAPNLSGGSWFDWITPEDKMVASTQQGVLKRTRDMSKRNYSELCPITPWELVLRPPDKGETSGRQVIPVGMGIKKDDQFLGVLSGGVDIVSNYQQMIQLISGNVNFIVFDKDQNPLFYSLSERIDGNELKVLGNKLFQAFNLKKEGDSLEKEKDFCRKPVEHLGIHFHGYEKGEKFPYYVFTGVSKELVRTEFHAAFFPVIPELGIPYLFCLIVIYVFWKRKVYPIETLSGVASEILSGNNRVDIPPQQLLELHQFEKILKQFVFYDRERHQYLSQHQESQDQLNASYKELRNKEQALHDTQLKLEHVTNLFRNSDTEEEKFLHQIDQKLEASFLNILHSARILLKNLEGHFDSFLSLDQQTCLIDKIIQKSESLKTLVFDEPRFEECDIQEIIQQSILIISKTAFLNHISINFETTQSLPRIVLDRLRFQQIVLGLLSRALQYTPAAGNIKITISQMNANQKICICIQDTGFGLDETDEDRIRDTFSNKSTKFCDLLSLDIAAIRKLVGLHKGSIQIAAKWRKGTSVCIFLPCNLEAIERPVVEFSTHG